MEVSVLTNSQKRESGFTIVELLVVIVAIGILAAITVVAYTGINQKAVVASVQSDLTNASKQIKMYYIDHGSYPANFNFGSDKCSTGPDDPRYCLKSSPNNTYTYGVNNTTNPPTFWLCVSNVSTRYCVTDSTSPIASTPITAIAIAGTSKDGQTLTASPLTPTGALATYQWQSAATSGGTYTNITGATSNTYILIAGDIGRYIEVVATGSGSYGGGATSAPTTVVIADPNWYVGQAEGGYPTSLIGKHIYYRDVINTDPPANSATPQYKTSNTACSVILGECSTTIGPAPDLDYPTKKVLVDPIANPGVDFSAYPAQATCKALGGRLPTQNEFRAIVSGYEYAGHYSISTETNYWVATEYNTSNAVNIYSWDGRESMPWYDDRTVGYNHVRCVRTG